MECKSPLPLDSKCWLLPSEHRHGSRAVRCLLGGWKVDVDDMAGSEVFGYVYLCTLGDVEPLGSFRCFS